MFIRRKSIAFTGVLSFLLCVVVSSVSADIRKHFIVTDCQSRQPISKAQIKALNAAISAGSASKAETGAEGFAEIFPLRFEGTHQFEVVAAGYILKKTDPKQLKAFTTVQTSICLDQQEPKQAASPSASPKLAPQGEKSTALQPEQTSGHVTGESEPPVQNQETINITNENPEAPRQEENKTPPIPSSETMVRGVKDRAKGHLEERETVGPVISQPRVEEDLSPMISTIGKKLREREVFAIQGPGTPPPLIKGRKKPPRGVFYAELGRSVARKNCKIDAFFGLAIWGKKRGKGDEVAKIRFSKTQPELRLNSNGQLGIRIAVTMVKDFSGTLTVDLTRTAPGGKVPPKRTYSANGMPELAAKLSADREMVITPPQNINGKKTRVIVETIEATVIWKPKNHKPCRITETLDVRWEWTNPRTRFRYWLPGARRAGSTGRTAVSHGRTIKPYTDVDGNTKFVVPVHTFYGIEDTKLCCCVAGTPAVIQLVRHEWDLKERRRKKGKDKWSLDVMKGEIKKAKKSKPYDPTFTHNPHGSNGSASPLVYPGPDPGGNPSVNQFDRPGFSPKLYKRFSNAGAGSTFTFHFLSFLVCKLEPSLSANYLKNGLVRQVLQYSLKITFRGPKKEPLVKLLKPGKRIYKKCRPFGEVMDEIDKKNRRSARKNGTLRNGYKHPQGHQVGIPKK